MKAETLLYILTVAFAALLASAILYYPDYVNSFNNDCSCKCEATK